MKLQKSQFLSPTVLRPAFIGAAGTGIALALHAFEAASLQLLYATLLVVAALALILAAWRRVAMLSGQGELLATPPTLAQDQELLDLYRSVSASLRAIAENPDPIYRDLALERSRTLTDEFGAISRHRIVFSNTETRRMAYETLLRSRGLYRYRSVAFATTANYWQDEPGRRSMKTNFETRADGLIIERIVILADDLWPTDQDFPVEPLRTWIDEQHRHGIAISLVRQSVVANEPILLTDLGIYGSRAVGTQEVDDSGRTARFTLCFDFPEILAAEQRWDRLALYATAYTDLVKARTESS